MLILTIPEQLKELREDRGLFQEQVADRLGFGANAVSRWEIGKCNPRVHHIAAYARLLDHRFVMRCGQIVVCDVVDALPRLGELRRRAGLSTAAVGARIYHTPGSVTAFESQTRRRGVRLSTLQPYLEALGYELALVPVEQELAATG
ncbi:helix-turn-helix domain-containing protein [Streptosporangium sp. G12]